MEPTVYKTLIRQILLVAGAVAFGVNSIHAEEIFSGAVPGTSSPYLAGLPSGTGCCQGDTAPNQSPVQVTAFSGSQRVLFFTVTGSVAHGPPHPLQLPDGNAGSLTTVSAENGISGIIAPIDSLVGVFLGSGAPNISPAPAALDFSTQANRDYARLEPVLKQVFFIGDGRTGADAVQYLIPPEGATRLYVGTMDGFEWNNNIGSFSVVVSEKDAIDNIRASQRSDTKIVDILYDFANATGIPSNVSVVVSTNNGATFDLPAFSFRGNVGTVYPGENRQITWLAADDWDNQLSSQVKFRVIGGSFSNDSPAVLVDTRNDNEKLPKVEDVVATYCNDSQHAYFLDTISLPLEFEVIADWNGKAGAQIQFIGPWGTDTQNSTDSTRTYDVGGNFGVGQHLTVKLIDEDGKESLPYQVNFEVVNTPPGIPSAGLYVKPVIGGTVAINSALSYASPEFSLNVLDSNPSDVDSSVPFFGGEKLGFITAAKASAEVKGDGSASASLSVGTGSKFSLAKFDVVPRFTARPEWTYSPELTEWVPGGYIGAEFALGFSTPPAYVFATPPVFFRADVEVNSAFLFGISGWNDQQEPIFNGVFSGNAQVTGVIGCGLSGFAALEGYLGGGPLWTIQYPAEPTVKQFGVQLNGGVRIVFFLFTFDPGLLHYEWWQVGAPDPLAAFGGAIAQQLKQPDSQKWKILSRDYLKQPYAVFTGRQMTRGNQQPAKEGPISMSAFGEVSSEVMQNNVFPYSQPSLAVNGTNRLLLWIWDNTNRAPQNRTELIWSKWDGTNWINPTPIWNDATADFTPAVKLFADGTGLAVWQNVNAVLPGGATLADIVAGLEIAAATFNPLTDTWTPANLTTNATSDHSPRLAAGTNGKALLTWISNATTSLFGGTNEPNTIESRLWDGASWQTLSPISTTAGMLLWSTVAYDGTNGVFLATIDPDDDQTTFEDQELWGAAFNGAAWSAFSRLTTNVLSDTKPQAVYDSTGLLLVAWHQGSNMVMRTGDLELQNATAIGAAGGASSAKDFTFITGNSGEISLVWEDVPTEGGGPDPMLLNYDSTLGVWSEPLRLLDNTNQLERSFSGAYGTNGQLFLAYNRVAVSLDTNAVPVLGQVDLMLLEYQVGHDLSVSGGDIILSTNNPAPGQTVTISAVVRNTGELAATNIQVAFFDGNPAGGGVQIGSTQTVAGVLVAGNNATVQVTWLIPASTTNRTIYVVVDPTQVQADRNRTDNTATKSVLAPDLLIGDTTVMQPSIASRILNARCVNVGTIPSGGSVDVTFRRGAVNGPVLAVVPIGILPTNGIYDASFEWNLSGLTFTNATELIYLEVDSNDFVSEKDEDNNTGFVSVMTTLDSDGDGLLDGREASYGANPQVADSDGDGLNDGFEVNVFHTNPQLQDTDSDGVPDGFEPSTATNPNVSNSPPVVITAQPQSQAASEGTNVTFTVNAAGITPLSYRWTLNGSTIPGATNSTYTRNNVQFTNAGNYAVVVSNIVGSATSSNAYLTVHGPPSVPVRLKLSAILPGTEIVTLVNNGGFQLQGPLVGTNYPSPPGWSGFGDMFANAGSNMVTANGGLVARGQVDSGAPVSLWQQTVALEPATAYVFSGYVWKFGGAANSERAVMDLDDVFNDPEMELHASEPQADKGYFVYRSFNTGDSGTNVNVRIFAGTLSTEPAYHPLAAQWDNIAITKAANFVAPLPKGPENLTWQGDGVANVWDVAATANWLNSSNAASVFNQFDIVTFNDAGSNNWPVSIGGNVQPAALIVNATKNYVIGGSGSIAGTNGLVKSGAGTLTLATRNTYSGASTINAGTLRLSGLANRWSFNNNLYDSVGGQTATIVDVGANNAVLGPNSVTLAGGARASSDFVSLGTNLLLNVNSPVTLELWATPVTAQNWSRIFDFGSSTAENLLMSWTRGTTLTQDRVEWRDGVTSTANDSNQPYTLGTEFHIAMVIEPGLGAGGTTRVTWYSAPASSGSLGAARGTFNSANTLAAFTDSNCWLGRSHFTTDNTANAGYNEFRIWARALTAVDLQALHAVGPDANLDAVTLSAGANIVSLLPVLPAASAVNLAGSGAALEILTGLSQPIGSLAGVAGSELKLRAGSLTTGGDNSSTTFDGLISGAGNLTKLGSGTLWLDGANTYTGTTLVNAGTLGGNGSFVGPLTVNPSGTVSPGHSIGALTVSNVVTLLGTTFMELDKAGATNDSIRGASTINYGGTLIVTRLGPGTLALGDRFRLFEAGSYSGTFTNITLPPLSAGLVWMNRLLTDGSFEVIATPRPGLSSVGLAGSSLVVGGTNGPPNGTYIVLTSTNVALPLINWTPLLTNQFDSSGNFIFSNAVSPDAPQRFFLLQGF